MTNKEWQAISCLRQTHVNELFFGREVKWASANGTGRRPNRTEKDN